MTPIADVVIERDGPAEPEPDVSAAKPWWCNPADIPPRQHLYEQHYIRGAMGATIAAGGRGKTTRAVYEGVSMAAGIDLTTKVPLPGGALRVCIWNGEEDQDELNRRIAATCQHYGVTKGSLGGRLFVQSVRDNPLRIAVLSKGAPVLNEAVKAAISGFIKRNKIDVFMIDPLVSFHGVIENDNMHMDLVIKEGFGAIANQTKSAGELFHHPGKPKPGQSETTVDDGRGASAILWAVRSARVLNFMTPEEAAKLGMSEEDRKLHIRITNGKANMGPLGKAKWMKLVVENLPNGDQVACATSWSPPDPFLGVTTTTMQRCRTVVQGGAYRVSSQSPDWIGYVVADLLSIDIAHAADNNAKDVARVKEILRTWFKNKVLATEKRQDGSRKERDYVIPGPWVPEAPATSPIEPEFDDLAFT